jgi:hypothetical protein
MANYITDENYLDIMVENTLLDTYKGLPVTYVNLRVSVVHIKLDDFDECLLGKYPYYSLPNCFTLAAQKDLDAAGVTKVQENPNFGLYGNGVLVAIIDTGIEYTHEAFRNSDGSSRIAAIWDQTIEDSSRIPEGFNYGAAYTKEEINHALKQPDPYLEVPTKDENGHGTMIAGAAAGSINASQQFQGVVPQAELVIVKCKQPKKYNKKVFMIRDDVLCYQETDIMLGMRYVNEFALKRNQPVSICLAVGTSQGSHMGYTAISKYADYITQMPRQCVTIVAGNEGDNKRHYYGSYTSLKAFVDFELNVDKKDRQFTMELWQKEPNRSALQIFAPSGESTETVYPKIKECRKFSFIFEPSQVWVNNIVVEEETGRQVIVVRFSDAQAGIWRFRVYNMDNSNADFNVWLPAGNIISSDTFFLDSNPNTSITVPGNAVFPITVTAYNSEDNSIWLKAGRGYTTNDIVKPDVAAPGVNIMCPMLKNSYASATGTGMAASLATGIVAMILEWAIVRGKAPYINGTDIRQLIIRGAVRDTGSADTVTYPNPVWGYGKINVFELFKKIS